MKEGKCIHAYDFKANIFTLSKKNSLHLGVYGLDRVRGSL